MRNFMDKVSSDVTKITQPCTAAQENTGKSIENVVLQVLTKPQHVTLHNPTTDSRTFGTICTSNSSCETNLTSSWPTTYFGMPQQSNNYVYHSQRPYVTPASPHAYVNQQPPNQTTFQFNQLVVELFRCQTKLTCSTQWLHQQITDALENIAKSSSF